MKRPCNGFTFGAPIETKLNGWRIIVRHEEELVKHVRLLQNTFRLTGIIPTWSNFLTTRYYKEMSGLLDADMVRKFRAWWNLMVECGDCTRSPGREEFAYCRMVLLAEAMMRRYAKHVANNPERFGVDAERAGILRDHVKSNYEALTLG